MADITILPSAQVQNVAPGVQSGNATSTTATPANLPQGTLLSGTIIGKDASGNFLLRTLQGNFSLHSTTPLTYNSDVTIRIDTANGSGSNARIVSVNGEPFSSFSAPVTPEGDSVSPALLLPANAAEPSAPTQTIQAVVVSTTQTEGNTPQNVSQPLTPGSTITINVPNAPEAQQTATNVPTPAAPPDNTVPANVAKLLQPASGQPVTPQTVTTASLPTNNSANISVPQTPASTSSSSAPQTETANIIPAAISPNATAQTIAQAANTAAQPVTTTQPSATPTQTTTNASTPSATLPENPPPVTQATTNTSTIPTSQGVTANVNAQTTVPDPSLYNAYKQPVAASANVPTGTNVAQPNSLQGTVISTNENNVVTLQTPTGTVTAQIPPGSPPLATGAAVTIDLPAAIVPLVISQPLSSGPASLPELAGNWQTLSDILDVVSASNIPAASTLRAQLPQLGADFLSSSFAFISNLARADAKKILGDDIINNLRQNGRVDLVQKFTSEVSDLSQAFAGIPTKQLSWQMILMPFVFQGEVEQARLYVKRDGGNKKERKTHKDNGDTRFIVEVDLSETGPLQLDGLVRQKQDTTLFDLMVRSKQPFSSQQQAEITSIYNNAAELTGFNGAVQFQVSHDFPVKPLDDIESGKFTSDYTV
jgi:hypothetical protein